MIKKIKITDNHSFTIQTPTPTPDPDVTETPTADSAEAEATETPVSYTHLDVYKRQVYCYQGKSVDSLGKGI